MVLFVVDNGGLRHTINRPTALPHFEAPIGVDPIREVSLVPSAGGSEERSSKQHAGTRYLLDLVRFSARQPFALQIVSGNTIVWKPARQHALSSEQPAEGIWKATR